jgi:cobalt-precorrin-5B (C1)-methyltransferase
VRYGFTTGSCAAAAAKAAAYMLLTGKIKNCITIETPKGIPYTAEVTDIVRGESQVSCAVVKDGGDDPDVTSGSKICATVTADNRGDGEKELLQIDGGKGVGRVTRPGLDQPVGNAAINHVPREMITREVQEVCRICDFHGTLHILISVPDGEALAERTFNPRLGIVGGISILGTTGIVEPMSSQALKETIRVELRQQRAEGQTIAAVSPGNYGLDFMQQTYGYDLDRSVKCSNFIGETIDMAAELGFCAMLLTGHIGKLMKPDDIFFVVSKSGESDFIRNIMIQANSKGVTTISLTRYGNNTLARMSTKNLFVNIEEVTVLEETNFESMTLMFIILEILFAKLVEYRTKFYIE